MKHINLTKLVTSFALASCLFVTSQAALAQAQCPVKPPPSLVEPGYLTIGAALSAPPMGFIKDDQPTGFDTELAFALADTMCLKHKVVNLAFAGLFPGLISKKFDLISSRVGITEVRQQSFDFIPDFVGGLRLITRKDSKLRFQSELDVCGYTVAIVAGSTQMAALERVKGDCPAGRPMNMKVFAGQNEVIHEVAKRSADVAFIDWPVAAYMVQQNPDDFVEASPILSGKGPNTERNRNGLVFRKGDDANRQAVEAAFKVVVQKGIYAALLKKWNLEGGDIFKAN
jgi:polar amino acid transport system substrate-binding protein